MILNDGLSLPLFYDGASTRRSQGASQTLGTVSAQATVPAYGATTQLTLASAYTGLLNETINIGYTNSAGSIELATYVVTAVGGANPSFGITLKNLNDTAGDVVAPSSALVVQPSNLGTVLTVANGGVVQQFYEAVIITMSAPLPTQAISQVQIEGVNLTVLSQSGNTLKAFAKVTYTVAPGDTVTWVGNNQPNVTVATLLGGFTAPAVGGTVQVQLATAYTGAVNQVVFIGSAQYQITATSNTTPQGSTISSFQAL